MASPYTEQHGLAKSRWCKDSDFLRVCQEVAVIFYCGRAAAHGTELNIRNDTQNAMPLRILK